MGTTGLQPFNVSKQKAFGTVMTHIPRITLQPFKEDASQIAARIVREATEDHCVLGGCRLCLGGMRTFN